MKINRAYRETGITPLYKKYEDKIKPQKAYLRLTYDGNISTYVAGEFVDDTKVEELEAPGMILNWRIPYDLSVRGVDDMIDELFPILKRVYSCHYEKYVKGVATGYLSSIGNVHKEYVQRMIEDYSEGWERIHFQDACDWYNNNEVESYKNQDVREYIKGLEVYAGLEGVRLLDIQDLRKQLFIRLSVEAAKVV